MLEVDLQKGCQACHLSNGSASLSRLETVGVPRAHKLVVIVQCEHGSVSLCYNLRLLARLFSVKLAEVCHLLYQLHLPFRFVNSLIY